MIKLFDKLGEIDGFTCEEKGILIVLVFGGNPLCHLLYLADPEEFLNTLLHVFKEEPYLVLR